MLLYVVTEEAASGSRTKLVSAVLGQNIEIGSRTKLFYLTTVAGRKLVSGSRTKLILVSFSSPGGTDTLVFVLPDHLLVSQQLFEVSLNGLLGKGKKL